MLDPKSTIELIIEEFSETGHLNRSLAKYGMTRSRFMKAVEGDFTVRGLYDFARRNAADKHAEEIIDISDTDPDPLRARNRIDTRRWYASKLNAKVYGDKLDLNVTERVNYVDVLALAESRMLPVRDLALPESPKTIDITTTSVNESDGYKPQQSEFESIHESVESETVDPFS